MFKNHINLILQKRNKETTKIAGAALTIALSLGFVTEVVQAAEKTVNIAVLYAAKAAQGVSLRQGAELATENINKAGGINGKPIQLTAYDAAMDPSEGLRAMQRAVDQDKADVIVGIFSSEVVISLMPWAKKLNIPLIVSGGTTTELPKRVKTDYAQYRNVFRVGITNSDQIAKMGAVAINDILTRDTGIESAVILTEDAAWAKPFVNYLHANFENDAKLSAKDWIEVPTNLTDFSVVYQKIKQMGVDLIFTGFAYQGLTPVLQWAEMRPTKYMGGISSQATGSDFYAKSNGKAEGILLWSQGANVAISKKTIPFYEQFVNKYKKEPLFTAYATYDAIYTYKDAVERNSGSTDTDGVINALEKTDYEGVTGRVQLGAPNSEYPHDTLADIGLVSGVMGQWQDGKLVVIWPKNLAQGSLRK